jgi:phospholipid/cholesterol/gamma-HCH transport system ATP-binding protein
MSSRPPGLLYDAPQQAVISFDNVQMKFAEGELLRGVSFQVEDRATLVLLGETGTGKTVSLKIAAGLLRPTGGSVRVLNQEVSSMRERELLDFRREIGFVFQEGALFDSMTVADNVAYRLREDGVGEEEIAARVRQILEFMELGHTYDQLPSELSGGMRRRVSIARAVVNRPAVVLYDSPTAGLDPVTSQTIISLILRLRDLYGVTSLLATQRLQDGFALANFHFDRSQNRVLRNGSNGSTAGGAKTYLLVLRDGRVYFQGSSEALAQAEDPYLKRFLV